MRKAFGIVCFSNCKHSGLFINQFHLLVKRNVDKHSAINFDNFGMGAISNFKRDL